MKVTQPGAMMTALRRLRAEGDDAAENALLAQILEDHPRFAPAYRWRIDTLLDRGDSEQALVLARQTLFQFPEMRAMATTRQAIALDRLGQKGAAMRVLVDLHRDKEQDTPASALLANLYLQDGSLNKAEDLFRAVLDRNPGHAGATRGLIDLAFARRKPNVVLELCDKALEQNHLPAGIVHLRRAQALDMLGRSAEAIADLEELVTAGDANDQVYVRLGQMHHKQGNLEEAERAFAVVLARNPARLDALRGQMAILKTSGAHDAALSLCDAAIAHTQPAPAQLYTQKAQLLMQVGRVPEAIRVLEQAGATNEVPEHVLLLADAHFAAGHMDVADAAYQRCASFAPTKEKAALGRAQISQRAGQHDQAVMHLRKEFEAQTNPSATLTLALCDALIRSGKTNDIRELIDGLLTSHAPMTDAQIVHVLDLAQRQTLPRSADAMIKMAINRPSISMALAQRLLRLGHITAGRSVLKDIARALQTKVPAAQSAEFRVEATALTDGPLAALAMSRQVFSPPRSPQQTLVIARNLSDAGKVALAKRYLRHASAKWPTNKALNTFFIHTCIAAHAYDEGHAHLDTLTKDYPDLDVERERLLLLHSEGASQDVLDRAIERRDRGLDGLHPRQFLELCLACGDLDRALKTQQQIQSDPTSTNRVAAHFTTGLHGRMLTDLQVYKALAAKAGKKGLSDKELKASLSHQYYYPAKSLLDMHGATLGWSGETRAQRIPKRVFQYWDSATVPEDVAALIAGWQSVPDYEHVLLNRPRAVTMLRRQFGPKVLKAFQAARHVTEESDLLRLCLIYKFGGIYSDADDAVVGNINELAQLGSGLVLAREPIGALANNTLIAPPGNPVLRIALKMTVQALLGRDADGAWFKSGPGMLTRAAAVYLGQTSIEEARANLTILDGRTLRSYIQPHVRLPYKKTVKYWNAQDKDISKTVLDSLIGIAKSEAAD